MIDLKKNKTLLYNLLGGIVFILLLLFIVDKSLDSYTHHGEKIKVPALYGLQTEEAANLLEELGLRYEIQDSLFEEKKPKNAVLMQNPDSGEFVKEGRIIYLSVNSSTVPTVKMPDLLDKNIKQALIILESAGLVIGRIDSTRDIAEDAVIEQRYRGSNIAPNTEIKQGSVIDLIIGDGNGSQYISEEDVPIPDLVDLSVDEVRVLLESYGLYISAIKTEGSVKDTSSATVVAQQPAYDPSLKISRGSGIVLTIKR